MALLSRLNAFFNSDKVGLPAKPGIAPTVSGEGAFGTRDQFAAQNATVHLENKQVIFVSNDAPVEGVFCEEDFCATR